jgi:hypothetical protein
MQKKLSQMVRIIREGSVVRPWSPSPAARAPAAASFATLAGRERA